MSKPFDASLKEMIESYPIDWPLFLGYPQPQRVELIDADISTVTAAADKVLRIHGPDTWLLHLEPQASADIDLAERLHLYNVVLRRRHQLHVRSVVLLLRRAADVPGLTGTLRHSFLEETPYLEFRYQVFRLWQMPVATVLTGGLGILPLAPLADVTVAAVPEAIAHMKERFDREATPDEASVLWTATYVLMGLRYPPEQAMSFLQGVHAMKESVTYQAILSEGEQKGRIERRAEEARTLLLRLGRKRLGVPETSTLAALEAITEVERLELLVERVSEVTSWHDLLGRKEP